MEITPDQVFASREDGLWCDLVDRRDVIDADVEDWYCETSPADDHDAAIVELEGVSVRGRMLVADRYRLIGDVLRQAEETPDPWVGADPTLDPGWVDPRDRTIAAARRERQEFAVRAAAADVAVRLRMSETTVRAHAAHAQILRIRCPRVWAAFLGGRLSEQNALTTAQLAASLPPGVHADGSSWAAFDEQIVDVAERLTPAKFRVRARSIRERVHAESVDERHVRAAKDRDVWMTPELDGMATLSALMPASAARAAMASVDARARHLRAQDGETRTVAQVRADVVADLLTSGAAAEDAHGDRAVVAVTVPVLSLIGESDEPAVLDGYGPIDMDTARRLAGSATSWIRILTHPVTGTVLDVDRRTYRVPKALKRWLGVAHPVCVFPGCARAARDCDIDHLIDWQHGGATGQSNLAPECESHHRLKHHSTWTVVKNPDSGAIVWASPTGNSYGGDPPPF